ncbi:uncharacterized protein LOC121726165 [Aricia agestis]|uniref:uncharacterized protein LOC121726165 n=1 Tax=Aricia agestis TaxID=91739 RepID=UPI001C20662B|nr:uncharacterized protein LOC121726165 [Aricia agestis]
METLLYETYKLIELNETQINGAWKGAHLLLFFLAFVFGSFCTFCFHMLMYFFEEKCVLYPKLLSLSDVKQSVIKEILPYDSEQLDSLPVDFVSTQWVEQSVCHLPTYVPLVSGICGLVWTTLFLMCSTGSRVFTGLEQSWRILPPVFLFSVVMGGVCVYTSVVTTRGLHELCSELADITGDTTCSFAINVVTLPYERRICGVYQAVELTVLTAWLHTLCWLLSALLTAARVLLAVDFQLVRVSVHLRGNVELILVSNIKLTVLTAWLHTLCWLLSALLTAARVLLAVDFQLVRVSVHLRGNIELVLEDHEHQVGSVGYDQRHWSDQFTLREDPYYGSSYLRSVPREQRFIVRTVFNLVNNAVTLAEFMRKHNVQLNQTPTKGENEAAEDRETLRPIKTQYDNSESVMSLMTGIAPFSFTEEKAGVSLFLSLLHRLPWALKMWSDSESRSPGLKIPWAWKWSKCVIRMSFARSGSWTLRTGSEKAYMPTYGRCRYLKFPYGAPGTGPESTSTRGSTEPSSSEKSSRTSFSLLDSLYSAIFSTFSSLLSNTNLLSSDDSESSSVKHSVPELSPDS